MLIRIFRQLSMKVYSTAVAKSAVCTSNRQQTKESKVTLLSSGPLAYNTILASQVFVGVQPFGSLSYSLSRLSEMGGRGWISRLKFMFSRKATKFDKIFTINLTLCSKCQINHEDSVNFCGLLRKHEQDLKEMRMIKKIRIIRFQDLALYQKNSSLMARDIRMPQNYELSC